MWTNPVDRWRTRNARVWPTQLSEGVPELPECDKSQKDGKMSECGKVQTIVMGYEGNQNLKPECGKKKPGVLSPGLVKKRILQYGKHSENECGPTRPSKTKIPKNTKLGHRNNQKQTKLFECDGWQDRGQVELGIVQNKLEIRKPTKMSLRGKLKTNSGLTEIVGLNKRNRNGKLRYKPPEQIQKMNSGCGIEDENTRNVQPNSGKRTAIFKKKECLRKGGNKIGRKYAKTFKENTKITTFFKPLSTKVEVGVDHFQGAEDTIAKLTQDRTDATSRGGGWVEGLARPDGGGVRKETK